MTTLDVGQGKKRAGATCMLKRYVGVLRDVKLFFACESNEPDMRSPNMTRDAPQDLCEGVQRRGRQTGDEYLCPSS